MTAIVYSRHAEKRMQQRGVRRVDIDLIVGCATPVGADVYFFSRKDAEREIRRRKQEIQALERLRNQKIVVAGSTVVTCYHSPPHDQKRLLRRRRELA